VGKSSFKRKITGEGFQTQLLSIMGADFTLHSTIIEPEEITTMESNTKEEPVRDSDRKYFIF
jgi:hypothetical protein